MTLREITPRPGSLCPQRDDLASRRRRSAAREVSPRERSEDSGRRDYALGCTGDSRVEAPAHDCLQTSDPEQRRWAARAFKTCRAERPDLRLRRPVESIQPSRAKLACATRRGEGVRHHMRSPRLPGYPPNRLESLDLVRGPRCAQQPIALDARGVPAPVGTPPPRTLEPGASRASTFWSARPPKHARPLSQPAQAPGSSVPWGAPSSADEAAHRAPPRACGGASG
jgi:hypothetical protein